MDTVKDILIFCNDDIFYEYINLGTVKHLNQVRICMINETGRNYPLVEY